jgi:ubiquinone/menaquinone biosynthesis C-methylase UbiE
MKEKGRLNFLIESVFFGIRGWLSPPLKKLREAAIQQGWRVLDFGCGIGSFAIAAARLVGGTGRVYAADCQPLAIERVKKAASKRGLTCVEAILTDCDTGLESASIDAVLMYDVLHDLERPAEVLDELARVLKKSGRLSFSDHHMNRDDILSSLTRNHKFKPVEEGRFTYTFGLAGELE